MCWSSFQISLACLVQSSHVCTEDLNQNQCVCCPSFICNYKRYFLLIIFIQDGISIVFLQSPAGMHARFVSQFTGWCPFGPNLLPSGIQTLRSAFLCSQWGAETSTATWADVLVQDKPPAALFRKEQKKGKCYPSAAMLQRPSAASSLPACIATIGKPVPVGLQETHHLTPRWPLFFLWCNKNAFDSLHGHSEECSPHFLLWILKYSIYFTQAHGWVFLFLEEILLKLKLIYGNHSFQV